ncbi:hypothetical protein ACFE04_024212 [Oxalis oulophora]
MVFPLVVTVESRLKAALDRLRKGNQNRTEERGVNQESKACDGENKCKTNLGGHQVPFSFDWALKPVTLVGLAVKATCPCESSRNTTTIIRDYALGNSLEDWAYHPGKV